MSLPVSKSLTYVPCDESFQDDKNFSAHVKEHTPKESITEQNIKVNYNVVDVNPKKSNFEEGSPKYIC